MWQRFLMICLAPVLLCAGPARVLAGPVPGECIAPFCLPSIDGNTQGWKPGRVTVLTFCAFWCSTWKDQSKRLAEVQKAVKGLPVEFVTISIDGRWSELGKDKFVGSLLLDRGRKLSDSIGVDRIPYTLVINKDGSVRYAVQGVIRSDSIAQSVKDSVAGKAAVDAGVVYLTFDDFPCPPNEVSTTPSSQPDERLLNALRKQQAPATFFCVCSRLKDTKELAARAVGDGHSLQVHSWDHNAGDPRIGQCVSEIEELTGSKPTLYRPPGSDKCLIIKGGEISRAVVNPYDYTRPGIKELRRRILLAVKPECVILLHVGVSDTIDVLPELIVSLKRQGYRFGTLH